MLQANSPGPPPPCIYSELLRISLYATCDCVDDDAMMSIGKAPNAHERLWISRREVRRISASPG